MIPTFVADASVAMAWTLESQSSPEAVRLLDETGSGCFAVPALWPFEVANTLTVMLHRRKISRDDYLNARLLFDGLRILIDDESVKVASARTADLALAHDLTVYDAAYLELAIRKQVPIASCDADLNRAARRCGVSVLL